MTQRRTPSGQGPSRRPGSSGRPTGRGAAARVGTARIESRGGVGRATPARTVAGGRADGGRPANRPPAARRSPAGATKRTVVQQPRAITGRAATLLVVLVLLALGYTYPVRVYLAQESKIGQIESQREASQREIEQLRATVAKWQDPEYVRTKARERLFFVRPGEVPLIVYKDEAGAAGDAGRQPQAPTSAPWYEALFSSVSAANQATPTP